MKGKTWVTAEHRLFWIGIIAGLLAFVVPFLASCKVGFQSAGRRFSRVSDLAALVTTNFCL